MKLDILDRDAWFNSIRNSRQSVQREYRAMYSTWWQGIVTDPSLMMIASDDHMVHRGDGVFEAARAVNGAIFDLKAHLERLQRSASSISLEVPFSVEEMTQICVATVKASGLNNATLRFFLSRGPGSFSPNPYESPKSQFHVIITDFKPVAESVYQNGAHAILSKIPQKPSFFAGIKSCNYLPNVLMKKEAVDAKVDFSLGSREDGVLFEGPTENLALLSREGIFCIPKFDYTLRGTTLICVTELIEKNYEDFPMIKGVQFKDLKVQDLIEAQEAFMIGTTLEVLPLVQFDGKPIGSGKVGEAAVYLRKKLQEMMKIDSSKRVEIV